ncbi:MAG: DNA translocase FtsK 4TM domain-containing protein [Cystobacterineae bacterium]|nr:DNA translocase FtsK 4TM domain-containing protein [Cystobacterineae bacterium]
MATRSAKSSVLSQQQIRVRRRSLQKKQALRPGGTAQLRRALMGIALSATSLLVLLSVASFSPEDRVGPEFYNWIGPMGHAIAETFRGALGICALIPPVAGLYAAFVLFVGNPHKARFAQWFSLGLLTVALSVLAQLIWADEGSNSHAPGGWLGSELGALLTAFFSTAGTVLLMGALAATALIVGTQYVFLRLCSFLAEQFKKQLLHWAPLIGGFAHKQWQKQWQKWKAYREARREAKQLEKEEEAAFLAELEAEEARLQEAEASLPAENAKTKTQPPPSPKAPLLSLGKTKLLKTTLQEHNSTPPQKAPSQADPPWVSQLLPTLSAIGPSTEKNSPLAKEAVLPTTAAPEAMSIPMPMPESMGPSLQAVEETPMDMGSAHGNATSPGAPSEDFLQKMRRTPLIVEPKTPPKPSPHAQASFEFIGGRKSFALPSLELLDMQAHESTELDKESFFTTAEKLRAKLADFGIVGEVVEIRPGPVVTMYEFLPGPGIKLSKIAALSDDLAMAMEAMRVRIVAPIPGKGVVGIEVPNKKRETVFLKEVAEQEAFQKSPSRLSMCLGKDIEGMPYVLDLAKAPHLLIAGTTGSGKSVAVNSMVMSVLMKSTPDEVRFIMVDPKMLELSVYEGIPHLLLPVVTDPKQAALALQWAVDEMTRRYKLLAEAGVRNIASFNQLVEVEHAQASKAKQKARSKKAQAALPSEGESLEAEEARVQSELLQTEQEAEIRVDADMAELEAQLAHKQAEGAAAEAPKEERKKLPYLVVIIDELADLMMVASKEVETSVARLAQMARAAGIHLMVATQRPSTDVVTGIIKANFPTRISFMLRSKPDSMTILGTTGAEALLGMGDMLIMPPTSAHLQRVHGCFVSDTEIKRAVEHWKSQGKPVYDENILKPKEGSEDSMEAEGELPDELYEQALAAVAELKAISISMLQRRMRIGYNRAARMIERMEKEGVVGPADGVKPREVLLPPEGGASPYRELHF